MKFSVSIVIVLMVGLLALVQPTGAVQGRMDGNNWTNIDSIKNQAGNSYILNSTFLCGANTTCTYNANGSVSISAVGGSVTGMANPATADFNADSYSVLNATNYTTSQGRHLENGGCDASYCIRYNLTNSSIIEAINGTTGDRDFSGTDALTLQNAINQTNSNGGGNVRIGKVIISTSTSLKTLLIKENVTLQGSGVGVSIIQGGANLQQTIIEMDNNSGLKDISINGNYANNLVGEGGWSSINDVPAAGGIETGLNWWNNGVQTYSNNTIISNVKIINTLRSNLVIKGYRNTVNTVYLENSYTDHLLYLSNANYNLISNVYLSGMASDELIVLGTSEVAAHANDNIIKNIVLDASPLKGKFGYPAKVISMRQNAGLRNTIDGVKIYDTDAVNGTSIYIEHSYSTVKDVKFTRRGTYANPIFINGTGNIISDIIINITNDDRATSTPMIGITGTDVFMSNINIKANHTGGNWRGMTLDASYNPVEVQLTNSIIDSSDYAFRFVGASNHVTLKSNNINLSYTKTILSTGTVYAQQNFGLSASTPTAFGFGDEYSNSTNGLKYLANLTSIFNPYLTLDKVQAGANITITKNYTDGTFIINSTGGSACTDCPNATVAANLDNWNATYNGSYDALLTNAPNTTVANNLVNWNATYNLSYAKGGLPFSINNGTNIIETDYTDSFTTVYAGTITKLIAHSSQTGSINVSFWNATAGNTYIDSVLITAGTDGSQTLSYAFSDETRIMFNVTSVTDIKKVALTVKTTKG